MKIWVLLQVFGLVTAVFALNGSSLNNPYVNSPVSSGTVPVTTYRSGLVNTPDPIDRTSDLIVTGNVGGGRHFRGYLPYNAVGDFGGQIGSGTLDEFLRRSTVPQNYYSGGVAPFYSQTKTVTYVVPGTNMVVLPPSTKVRTQDIEPLGSGLKIEQAEDTSSRTSPMDLSRTRFFPIDTQQLEPYLYQSEEDQAEKEKARETYLTQQEQFVEQLKELSEEADTLQKKLISESVKVKTPVRPDSKTIYEQGLEEINKPLEPLEPELPSLPTVPFERQRQEPEQIDVYERMLQEYEESQKAYEEIFPESQEEPQEQTETQQMLPSTDAFERKLVYKRQTAVTAPGDTSRSEPVEKKPMSDLEVQARARRILSERQTFAAYSQDKFNKYMRAAEQYMQQGKFYLAADAYSLASVYKPLDPLGYAGRSHALFAAGDYMSSALYLNHTIEMFNGYVDFKIDIVTMIGNMDTVEKRIADIKGWIELNSAPELYFLLAYIYMQLDRPEKASEAVNAAYDKMPEVPAVGILKAAIERRLNK